MAEGTRDQVAAIRRLVKRSTTSKTGQVAGRRGPLGKVARQLVRSQAAATSAGKGRKFNTRRGKTRRV